MTRALTYFIAVSVLVLGTLIIAFALYIRVKYGTSPVTFRGHNAVTWPGLYAAVSLVGVVWAIFELWLHGGPKARRQAKLDAQRQAQEASAGPPEAPPAAPEPLLSNSEEQTGQAKP